MDTQNQNNSNKSVLGNLGLNLSPEEIKRLHLLSLSSLSNLEKQAQLYEVKQIQRDAQLEETNMNTNQDINNIKEEINRLKKNIDELKKTFTMLIKNFRNIVKKKELETISKKIDSMNLEFLATDDYFSKKIENIKRHKAITKFIKRKT